MHIAKPRNTGADDEVRELASILGALEAGAYRFVTGNSRDFSEAIEEIDIVYPSDLPPPTP